MYQVIFKFENQALESRIVQADAGESLLDVAMEHDIELHHNCGGVCACTTCHVYVTAGMDKIAEMTDREEDYIDRADSPRLNSRLACQCEIINGNVEVLVPDQSRFLGH